MIVKAGLVLEGGASRGLFTAGALDVLMENNIYFEYVVSVSAGTCCALGYIAEQKGRTKNCMFPSEEDTWIGKSLLKKGKSVIDLDKAFYEFPYKQFPLDFKTYMNSKTVNEMVAIDVDTGRAVYFVEKDDEKLLLEKAKASCSLPIISKAVHIGGHTYYDGGLADSLPYKRAMQKGYDKVFVIQTRQLGKYPTNSKSSELLYKTRFIRHPKFRDALLGRPLIYKAQAEELRRLEEQGKVFVIRPTLDEIDRMEEDYNKKLEYYNHGYETMKEQLAPLKKYLGITNKIL